MTVLLDQPTIFVPVHVSRRHSEQQLLHQQLLASSYQQLSQLLPRLAHPLFFHHLGQLLSPLLHQVLRQVSHLQHRLLLHQVLRQLLKLGVCARLEFVPEESTNSPVCALSKNCQQNALLVSSYRGIKLVWRCTIAKLVPSDNSKTALERRAAKRAHKGSLQRIVMHRNALTPCERNF
jgi:hypothetical protein